MEHGIPPDSLPTSVRSAGRKRKVGERIRRSERIISLRRETNRGWVGGRGEGRERLKALKC